eukprot:gene58-654_t
MESEQMIFEEDDQTDLISNESWEPVPGGSGSEGQNVDTPEKDVCNTESTVGVFEIADLPIYMYELSQSKGVSPCKEDLTIFCVNDFDSKNKRIKKNSFVFVYRRPLKFANDDVSWVYGCTCNRNELMSLKSYAQELDLTFADFKDIRGTCIHAKAVDEFLANFCTENNIPLHQYNTAEFTDDQLKESIPVPVYPVSSSDSSVAVWSESNQMGLVTSRYNELYCLTCPQPRRCSHCKILQEHFASETEGLPKEATDLQDAINCSNDPPEARRVHSVSKNRIAYSPTVVRHAGYSEEFLLFEHANESGIVTLSPTIVDNCDCGCTWLERNLSDGNIQRYIPIFMQSGLLRANVLHYECSSSQCSSRLLYDGNEDGLLNMGSYFVTHRLMRDFRNHFLNNGQPMFTFRRSLLDSYIDLEICYGFEVMVYNESVNVPFDVLYTRFPEAPKTCIYDNACSLHEYALLRRPQFFKRTWFLVDRLHWKNHV